MCDDYIMGNGQNVLLKKANMHFTSKEKLAKY